MIILLVAHHIDHLINGIILEAHFGRADILRHINTGAIAAKKQLLIQALVGEVCPDGVILMTLEEPLCETLFNLGLSLQVGL